jgi:hypothetical protein
VSDRTVGLVLVALLCLSLVGAPGAVAADDRAFQQSSPEEDEEETAPHEHPDEADEEGNLDAIRDRLQQDLDSRLGDSQVQLEQGQYDQARETLGDDYDESLSRFAEVEGETDDDGASAEDYEDTRDNQEEFIDSNEEYDRTYEEYQQAREEGDDERAQELARDLEDLERDIDDSGSELEESYDTVSESSGSDFSEQQETTRETRENVSSTQEEVQSEEFIVTELVVEPSSETISFTDPLVVEGQLATEDGQPIANETVQFAVGEQTITTETDANGQFEFTYRPTALPLETEELTIEYVAPSDSDYASTSASVPVSVEQTTPTVTLTESPTEGAYGETVAISGSVAVDDVGASAVPVVISIGGEPVGQTWTNPDGSFDVEAEVPAGASAENAEVRAAVPDEDRALAGADAREPIDIQPTESALTADSERTDAETVRVTGQLATANGVGVAGEPIEIQVGGTTLVTAETDENGTYDVEFSMPTEGVGESLEIRALYAPDHTALDDAQATTSVQLPAEEREEDEDAITAILGTAQQYLPASLLIFLDQNRLLVGSLSTLLGLTLLVLFASSFLMDLFTRRDDDESATAESTGTRETVASPSSEGGEEIAPTLLERARRQLQTGHTDRAVETAYVAARRKLDDGLVSAAATHWEFYRERQDNGISDEEVTALRSLTEEFEQAAFTNWEVSSDTADDAIEQAETVVDKS